VESPHDKDFFAGDAQMARRAGDLSGSLESRSRRVFVSMIIIIALRCKDTEIPRDTIHF
jgi:hypothetical protein